jgi:hypothetical protein
MEKRREGFKEVARRQEYFAQTPAANEDIQAIAHDLRSVMEVQDPIERSISALLSYHNRTHAATQSTIEDVDDNLAILNIFTKLRISDGDRSLVNTDNFDRFSTPLLAKIKTHETLMGFERLSGKIDKYAVSIADEIIRDMETATHYPPVVRDPINSRELASTIESLSQAIIAEREKAKAAAETTTTTT